MYRQKDCYDKAMLLTGGYRHLKEAIVPLWTTSQRNRTPAKYAIYIRISHPKGSLNNDIYRNLSSPSLSGLPNICHTLHHTGNRNTHYFVTSCISHREKDNSSKATGFEVLEKIHNDPQVWHTKGLTTCETGWASSNQVIPWLRSRCNSDPGSPVPY